MLQFSFMSLSVFFSTNKPDKRKFNAQENGYKMDRALAYPQLAEQLDKLWHDINNGTLDETGEFFTALKTVKDNNPKP